MTYEHDSGEPIPESVLWDDWHAIAEETTVVYAGTFRTALFGRPITVVRSETSIECRYSGTQKSIQSQTKYGFVWACLGEPVLDVVDFPIADEEDRYVSSAGSLGVASSGLRVIENFLDLAHLPFVHTDYLGAEPDTEVFPYTVQSSEDGLVVRDVRFQQPQASPTAEDDFEVEYEFRVLRPYTVMLEKSNPLQRSRRDAVALMVQPVSEEQCVLHLLVLYLKHGDPNEGARWFTRFINSQDKPIVENQRPLKLPLDLRSELPIRADAASIAYRAWLVARGVRYGAIVNDSMPVNKQRELLREAQRA